MILALSQAHAQRTIDKIIVHCTATPEGMAVHASDVRRWHRAKGWKDIGYHYLVTIDGKVEAGRDVWQIGAHCYGHNSRSIGVCYVGGLDAKGAPKDTRTEPQRTALTLLLSFLQSKFPKARIYGHRDFSQKSCPCFEAGEYNPKK